VAQLSEVTDPSYLDGLEGWTLGEVRSRRDEATETETALSYLRRMVQGTLDLVVAELGHREHGERADVSELVDELSRGAILSDHVRAPGLGRLPALLAPGEIDHELEQRLESIMPAARLANLPDLSDDELRRAATALTEFERSVSTTRRSVLDVLDRLQEEIVRRYRTGEATVDSLLP
jgi:hypothetical protein